MKIDIFAVKNRKITDKIYIRYSGFEGADLDLKTLGESLIGFNFVIPEILSNAKINGEIKVSVASVDQGSIIFGIELQVMLLVLEAFKTTKDIHDFLQVVDLEGLKELHTSINQFAQNYPVDYDLIKYVLGILGIGGLGKYFICLLQASKDQKQSPKVEGENYILPARVAESLHRNIAKNIFKKAFKPFVEAKVKTMQISPSLDFTEKSSVEFSILNFGDYLGDDQEILPDLENGDKLSVQAKLIGLQSSKGESMKIRISGYQKNMRDFICFPASGIDTKVYTDFYKEDNLKMILEVVRETKYVKPRFIVHDMERTETILSI